MYAEVRVTGNTDEQATWAEPDDLEVIDVTPAPNSTTAPTDTPVNTPAAEPDGPAAGGAIAPEGHSPTEAIDTIATAMGATGPSRPEVSRPLRALLWASLVLTVCLVAVGTYALFIDSREAVLAPRGVSVAGINVGGLPADGIREAISKDLDARRTTEITLRHGEATWPVTVGEYSSVDVEAALAEVFEVRAEASLLDRLRHDLLGEALIREVEYDYSVDREAIVVSVGAIADGLNTDMLNARLKFRDGHPVWEAGRDGVSVDEDATIAALVETVKAVVAASPEEFAAMDASDLTVEIVYEPTPRLRTAEDLVNKAIKVDLSAKKLTLYDKDGDIKTWPVATGTPGFPTPEGTFRIVLKRYMPTWGNPGSDWAKDMPPFIPPGPDNPLGLRALNLNAPGIRIHGTSNIGSIGTAASHGCVRMTNASIIELYDMVEVGTPVFIVK